MCSDHGGRGPSFSKCLPRGLTSYTSPGLHMQKTSSIDCLSSSTLWSSRHLLKQLTRPAQSDMPQLRRCSPGEGSPSRGFATCGCHSVATWRFFFSRCSSRLLWKPCNGVSKLQAGSCVYCVGNLKAAMPHVSVLCARSSCFVPVFWCHASESFIPQQLAVALSAFFEPGKRPKKTIFLLRP